MSTDLNENESTVLSPDKAFNVLGNETRIKILRTLDEADEPVQFAELHKSVGSPDSGNFNYHLGKLEGHFIHKTNEGYVLHQTGRRIIEAVLSGAVTENPVLDPTRLDAPCPYCGSDIEISYLEERVLVRCTNCAGSFPNRKTTLGTLSVSPHGMIGVYNLPSAGFQGRTPREILDIAILFSLSETMDVINDFCPRCSGKVESSLDICEEHDTDNEICERCNSRFAIIARSRCTNCNHIKAGAIKYHIATDLDVRSFFADHGVDLISPKWEDTSILYNYEEEILSIDPFEARITFTVDNDQLVVTVEDDLNVIDVTRSR
ncbi:MAG: helix-turn-helix domain-containing protein [Halobacteria archaeon]|nr:helix-turn-helix domain-containing protein [Halobacteria archaeon]